MDPRGIRNRNPTNIRWVEGITSTYRGCTGHDDAGFCVFDTAEHGIEAAAHLLLIYQDRHGLKTVRGVINRWAPSSENDTKAYVAAVSNSVGVGPDEVLDLHSPAVLVPLVAAMIQHENGQQPYTSAQLNAGVYAALGLTIPEPPEPPAPPATPPQAIPAPPQSPQEAPMGGIGLILGLLQTLLPAFSQGAQAKIAPVLAGLTGQPVPVDSVPVAPDDKTAAILAFASQMMASVLQASGHANPAAATDAEKIQATAAVMASPALVQKVEDDAMARLDKMGPTFDRLTAIDQATNEAMIAGRDAAAARGRQDVWDMAKALVFSSEGLIWFTMALLCSAVIVQICLNDSHEPSGVLVGMIGPLLMMIYKNRSQPFDYRFDGTPSSNASNAINAELARKQ